MTATQPADFKIVRLPSLQLDSGINTQQLLRSYRAFRLSSLQNDPDAFASTYLEESREGDEFWQDRLANPKASHFIAVVPKSDWVSSSNWFGMVVLLGPQDHDSVRKVSVSASPWSSFSPSQKHGVEARDETERNVQSRSAVSFHLNGTYTIPTARRRGIGAALFQYALRYAEDICRQSDSDNVVCTLYVDADNRPAVRLYEDRGFQKVEEMMYKPKPVETGEREEKLAWKMVMQKSI